MKGISNLIALLFIISIVIGISVFVTSTVLTQISRATEKPTHLQIVERNLERVSPYAYRVIITYYNPTDKEFTVRALSATIRRGGNVEETLSLIDSRALILKPGDTGKLEMVWQAKNYYANGVLIVSIQVSVGSRSYTDNIPIPFS